jgi:acetyltransferase
LITNGGELTKISAETMEAFNEILPASWSHNNPVDIIGDASPERYAKALEIAARDPNSDGILVILTPQAMTDPTKTANELVPYAQSLGKPVIASWMGGNDVAPGEAILNKANIPAFPYPDTAARVFDYMAHYSENLRLLYETPMPVGEGELKRECADDIIRAARESGRTILTEFESKELLSCYGIPTVETRIAKTPQDAVTAAGEIGYPVVLKLHSETITHKTDVGGVQLNLADSEAVRNAYTAIQTSVAQKVGSEHFLGVTVQPMAKIEGYELILGSSIDPQFGPVLLFGLGGQLVEVFKDRALSLPPLTTTRARRMMERTKIYTALKGVRGRDPVDLVGLERLLVRFAQLVTEQRWIKELDINPLMASPEQLIALDARVVLYDKDTKEEQLPKLAIRPYPIQYVGTWEAKDRTKVTIRPILPEDEGLLVKFHQILSDRTVFMRYLQPIMLQERVMHERLARLCHVDYDREIALVAEATDDKGEQNIMGIVRLSRIHATNEARLSVLIGDPYQGIGLGGELVRRAVDVARKEGMDRLNAILTEDNLMMRHIFEKVGFSMQPVENEKLIAAFLKL